MLLWKRQGTWNATFGYYFLILCCGGFLYQTICAESHLWIHALGTHPPADFTQWKQFTASCWDQSQGLNKAGFWEGGKERMGCPWHLETNIWTGRSFSNRKAIERQDWTMCLYSVETAAALLQSGWWPKGGIFVCSLAPQLVWARA